MQAGVRGAESIGLQVQVELARRIEHVVAWRPAADGGIDAFYDYVYTRANPRGWHTEWWHHSGGCRQFVKVVRHTMTHAIAATGKAGDTLPVPVEQVPAERAPGA